MICDVVDEKASAFPWYGEVAMCWSATADLTAGTAITAVGIACLVRTRRIRGLPVAALPLILGAHQLVEAAVWRSGGGCGPATTAWAVIALPLLAAWVPLGVLLAAAPAFRPRLWWPVASGLATGAYLSYCLATRPVSAEIRSHVLGYGVHVPWMAPTLAAYLFATLGSLSMSGDRLLRVIGALMAAGALVCAVLWRLEFASTRCAFGGRRGRADPGLDRPSRGFPLCTQDPRAEIAGSVTPVRAANRPLGEGKKIPAPIVGSPAVRRFSASASVGRSHDAVAGSSKIAGRPAQDVPSPRVRLLTCRIRPREHRPARTTPPPGPSLSSHRPSTASRRSQRPMGPSRPRRGLRNVARQDHDRRKIPRRI
ncbi:DUF6629 family protein [Streptomyces sp. ISL-66]|uniref:DUF6629 family protein n=1 Tax=Streptomyces sp. ISL-66 TaxID=2819186 RepID=UPI0027E3FBD4|nr:DUF6629 family protein [Streptomyces sp. ISL-66]